MSLIALPARARCRLLQGLLAVLAAVTLSATTVHAAAPLTNCTDAGGVLSNANQTCTFTVTTNGDSVDTANPSEYVALAGSLRRAILDANAWGNYGNTVAGNSVIDATALGGQTITLSTQSLPLIFSNVTVLGPAAGLTIDGGGSRRCLFVSGLPTTDQVPGGNNGTPQAINVALSNLNFSGCSARGGEGHSSGLGAGGALFVNQNATVSVTRSSFQSSSAQSRLARPAEAGGGMSGGVSRGGGGLGGGEFQELSATWYGGVGIGSGEPLLSIHQSCSATSCHGGGGFGGDGLGQISARQGFSRAAGGGGLNGGGGGADGHHGHGSGVGGSSDEDGGIPGVVSGTDAGVGGGGSYGVSDGRDPNGGFGGGGGSQRGNGGFGGGGGSSGSGGFGGGGGRGGGNGGFGGAGGSGGGIGGFAAGNGEPTLTATGGGTGAALGGAIFVVQGGNLIFADSASISGGSVTSSAASGGATSGAALGTGMFLQGSGALTFSPPNFTQQSVLDDISDQTGSWPALGISADKTYATGGPFNGTDWSYTASGRWNLVKNGNGILRLDGANTFSGAASVVHAGELFLNGDTALGFGSWTNHALIRFQRSTNSAMRTYTLGSTATGMPNANFTQSATGVMRMLVFNSGCNANTRLQVKNTATLGGVLEFDFRAQDNCAPVAGNTFTVLTAGSVTGSFATIRARSGTNLSPVPAGHVLVATYTATTVTVRVVAQCTPGSFSATGLPPCTSAAAGNFVATTGATSQTPCTVGSYQPGSGQASCLQASAGNFVSTTAATAQTPCAVGRYQDLSGQTSCKLADAGNYVNGTGASSQTPCTVGRYQPDTGQDACINSSLGHYVPLAGATAQIACTPGTFQDEEVKPSCSPAIYGFYAPGAAATMMLPCAAGFGSHSAATACSGLLNIDFSDGPNSYGATTDGLILLRYLRGMTGSALTQGVTGTNPRRDSALIVDYFTGNRFRFDVDGDGQVHAESDGVMIVRRLMGFTGAALTKDAKLGTRTDQQVQDAIDALRP